MSARFADQGVMVTGAAQGLGRAVAKAFTAEGAGVVLLDVDADTLEMTARQIRDAGGRVEPIVGDVRRRDAVKAGVDLAVDRFGRLDVAVQVAGIAEFVSFLEFEDERWDRILDINLKGTFYLVQEAARAMVRQRTAGAIAITSSTNAYQPEAGGLAYNTSKSAQVAVMHTAAMELAAHGIRVNAIAPGIMNTSLAAFLINHPVQSRQMLDRIPLGRFVEPEEMARPILWMCSQDAGYMTGELLVFDGGLSVGLPDPSGGEETNGAQAAND
jgi:NAD(P)-dependent dehydrogenase (short-subunit alcohol dehydrogenase family)